MIVAVVIAIEAIANNPQTLRDFNGISLWTDVLPSLRRRFSRFFLRQGGRLYTGYNGIRTHGPCVRAAVLYQLSSEDPYLASKLKSYKK